MTQSQLSLLRLGIEPINERTCLNVESGLLWVKKNTTLKFNINNDDELEALPANVRLFLVKYNEIMNLRVGITSESISNLSQSFNSTDVNSLVWQAAEELLGDEMQSQVKVFGAKDRWC